MNEQEWIEKLTQEGFTNVLIFPLGTGFDMGEHTHGEHTVHVIMSGELIISNGDGEKTFGPGERVEFPAGTKHYACGGQGALTMIVGTKSDAAKAERS